MKALTSAETARWLLERDSFLILTHRRPDGDTIGSAAALCLGLRQRGKTAHLLRNPDFTDKFAFLYQGLTRDAAGEADTIVTVDVAAPDMLPNAFGPLAERAALRIDHHGTGTSFTARELVAPEAAACGEIIYDLLLEMGVTLDKAMADALYTAVSTDTGCFRYANTGARTFTVAAACVQAGCDLNGINLSLFETNSLARLRVQAYLVENARFLYDGKIAICPLPGSVEARLGASEDDMDNISSFPRTIEGVRIAATLRENRDGSVKLSVRAVPGYDAGAICQRFGGGGHKGAAGATVHLPLEQAVEALIAAMPVLD